MEKRALCRICNEVLPSDHVQQGGCHMGCYNQEIEVFKICLDGACYFSENIPDDHDDLEISTEKIHNGLFLDMPEFEGF